MFYRWNYFRPYWYPVCDPAAGCLGCMGCLGALALVALFLVLGIVLGIAIFVGK